MLQRNVNQVKRAGDAREWKMELREAGSLEGNWEDITGKDLGVYEYGESEQRSFHMEGKSTNAK